MCICLVQIPHDIRIHAFIWMCQTRECYIGKHMAVISHCRTMKPSHQKTVQKRFEKQNKKYLPILHNSSIPICLVRGYGNRKGVLILNYNAINWIHTTFTVSNSRKSQKYIFSEWWTAGISEILALNLYLGEIMKEKLFFTSFFSTFNLSNVF